jgi:hypothetical protein
MSLRTFALLYGVVFTAVGIAGFVPGLLSPHDSVEHSLTIERSAGHLFGLFPVNLFHNLVHIAFGVWGLGISRQPRGTIIYARSVAVVYAVFAVMGLIPGLDTVFGLVPLYGHDVWLHALLALGAAYFGFVRHGEQDIGDHRPAARGT